MPLEKRRRILHRNGILRPARALRLYETADYSAVLASIHQKPWQISAGDAARAIPWRWLGGIVTATIIAVIVLPGTEDPQSPPPPRPPLLALPKGARVQLYKSDADARSSMLNSRPGAVALWIGLSDDRPYTFAAELAGVIEAIDASGRHVFINAADIDKFKAMQKK